MYDVTALGELLIDFTQNGCSGQGNPLFEANPGGAPCNVLAMLSRLGYSTAFIGKVGNDSFGRLLERAVSEAGIASEGLVYDDMIPTTLALVHNGEDGDRNFSFYRKPGADIMLEEKEISEPLITDCRIFHFGSVSMTDEPVRTATQKAVRLAGKEGKWISFDPNLRPPLWNDENAARQAIWEGIQSCHILKIADNEIQWLTGETDYDQGVSKIRTCGSPKLITVTLGKEGSIAYQGDKRVYAEAFLSDRTVDTTGAGDTFCACVLAYVLEHGLENLTEEELKEMLIYANGAASIVTTRKGALRSMPCKEEIEKLIQEKRPGTTIK